METRRTRRGGGSGAGATASMSTSASAAAGARPNGMPAAAAAAAAWVAQATQASSSSTPTRHAHAHQHPHQRHAAAAVPAAVPAAGATAAGATTPSKPTPSSDAITVAVRIRPQTSAEAAASSRADVIERVAADRVLISRGERHQGVLQSQSAHANEYVFDHVFAPDATSKEVYEATARALVRDTLRGKNCTVFAYGATGAGKTHTMMGNAEDPGIIPRAMMDLFAQADALMRESDVAVTLTAAYMEIYNETVRDLLSDRDRALNPCEDPSQEGAIRVLGLTERRVTSVQEVLRLLGEGNGRRKTEPTAANQVSSRSHAILQISVTVAQNARGAAAHEKGHRSRHTLMPGETLRSGRHAALPNGKGASSRAGAAAPEPPVCARLSLIDLAGSERASHTLNRGARLREGANINRSLLALANCINALSRGERVKYRDSKLTHILKCSLEPNNKCRVVMVAAVSPNARTYEESHNTLKYANRAKDIKAPPLPVGGGGAGGIGGALGLSDSPGGETASQVADSEPDAEFGADASAGAASPAREWGGSALALAPAPAPVARPGRRSVVPEAVAPRPRESMGGAAGAANVPATEGDGEEPPREVRPVRRGRAAGVPATGAAARDWSFGDENSDVASTLTNRTHDAAASRPARKPRSRDAAGAGVDAAGTAYAPPPLHLAAAPAAGVPSAQEYHFLQTRYRVMERDRDELAARVLELEAEVAWYRGNNKKARTPLRVMRDA